MLTNKTLDTSRKTLKNGGKQSEKTVENTKREESFYSVLTRTP